MKKRAIGGMLIVGFSLFSAFVGSFFTEAPVWLAVFLCVAWTNLSIFLGMVLSSFRHRSRAEEAARAEHEEKRLLHQGAVSMLRQQSVCYQELTKAVNQILAGRIGERVVEEVLDNNRNHEQREAAINQVGGLILEEIEKINNEVWGGNSCREEHSEA